MNDVSVRDAGPSDADAIAAVQVAAWRAAYDTLLPADLLAALSVGDRAEQWSRALDDGMTVLVAEADCVIAGFACVGPSRDDDACGAGELYAIYLHPDQWSKGIGHRLHEAALTRAANLGYDVVSLWVLDTNERAIGFYERHGWRSDGSVKLEDRGQATLREQRFRRPL